MAEAVFRNYGFKSYCFVANVDLDSSYYFSYFCFHTDTYLQPSFLGINFVTEAVRSCQVLLDQFF